MKTLESPPNDIDSRTQKILDAVDSSDYIERQIQLIAAKLTREHPELDFNRQNLNDAGLAWTDESGSNSYARKFAQITKHPNFKTHPKFIGDVANITLEDMEKPLEELFLS